MTLLTVRFSDSERLVYNSDTVFTWFGQHYKTGGPEADGDAFHARNLGITPMEHRLLHELAHHLVARALGYPTCPILHAAAFGNPMPPGADLLEWYYTAVSYFTFRRPPHGTPDDYGALADLTRKKVDLGKLSRRLELCLRLAAVGPATVEFK